MAIKAHMSIDVYLRSFEYEPDAQYVDGDLRFLKCSRPKKALRRFKR